MTTFNVLDALYSQLESFYVLFKFYDYFLFFYFLGFKWSSKFICSCYMYVAGVLLEFLSITEAI